MEEYNESINLEVEINAYPMSEVERVGEEADIILLGPQVRFNLNKVQDMFPDKPVEVINMQDYGLMKGDNVMKMVIEKLDL